MVASNSRRRPRPSQRVALLTTTIPTLLLSACTSAPSEPALSVTTAASSLSSTAAPNLPLNAGALTAQFKELAAGMRIPGAALLIRTPAGEVTATYGVTTLGGSTPVSLEDHIRIGSNTKTWTGTVILQLVQEHKVALSDPVSKYRPDVPNGKIFRSNSC